MAMLFRVAGRHYGLLSSKQVSSPIMSKLVPMASVKALTTKPPKTIQEVAQGEMLDFWKKNETLKRPISPHLTIWRSQLPMTLSFFHRFTGVAMICATYVFSWVMLASPVDYQWYITFLKDLHIDGYAVGPSFLFLAKFIIALPFCYHCINGVRHLAWDLGKGFDLPTLYRTGYFVSVLSILVALYLASLSFKAPE
ncbi:succinate dehydrogenase cytochrome b560 subunit, mitochondrial-like [Lingula anatina]|uniref:Succinate dehydrogenase cytochrome b560 subunit, mitochondrial-like n=1 Tax=Lingula anatina TaxID=7574 RepID=A0A1S3HJQ8_LINAN|nr:succinate dehydrogenase cytochrome b560 subunit, mitochondrial-like [Lingula anatina]|eukprot:XP_013386353.1 succinate dehydrogenase cytochrome b560 subunit, mitochondrial-like [Lingula anatina]